MMLRLQILTVTVFHHILQLYLFAKNSYFGINFNFISRNKSFRIYSEFTFPPKKTIFDYLTVQSLECKACKINPT